MQKIVKCHITAMPQSFLDDMPQVIVTLEGETEPQLLFEFYPDEIFFSESEFIGLTLDEARQLKSKKDKQYLQS